MITLELVGDAELALYLDGIADRTAFAAGSAMLDTVEMLAAIVTEDKLSGQVLDVQSGDLRDSIRFAAEIGSAEVIGRVFVDPSGKASRYGAVHENGGIYEIPEHISHSRLGNAFTVRAHEADFPERSFLRSALSENMGLLGELFADSFARELAA